MKGRTGLTSGRSTSLPRCLSSPLAFPAGVRSVGLLCAGAGTGEFGRARCMKKRCFGRSCNRTDVFIGVRSTENLENMFHRRCFRDGAGDAKAREDWDDYEW
jgi:hypothetical protein